jgi:8-oxo-dGTP pyrophosphatase MutT (NUDIX family)
MNHPPSITLVSQADPSALAPAVKIDLSESTAYNPESFNASRWSCFGIVYRDDGKRRVFLCVGELGKRDYIKFPGGKDSPGETQPCQTLIRELNEEVSIRPLEYELIVHTIVGPEQKKQHHKYFYLVKKWEQVNASEQLHAENEIVTPRWLNKGELYSRIFSLHREAMLTAINHLECRNL